MIEKAKEEFDYLPIINTWEDVFDEGICKGTVNWQLYGSKNRITNHMLYYMLLNMNLIWKTVNPWKPKSIYPNSIGNVIYINYQCVMINMYRSFEEQHCGYGEFIKEQNIRPSSSRSMIRNEIRGMRNNNILNVKNHEELKICVEEFLNSLGTTEYYIVEAHKYVHILPEKYYGNGSYEKWIRVGWVLAHISDKLFTSWISFSAQSPVFNFAEIPNLYEMWNKFDYSSHGLKKGSLIHWARNDANCHGFQIC